MRRASIIWKNQRKKSEDKETAEVYDQRRPVSGKKGVVSKLMGDHLFFKIL